MATGGRPSDDGTARARPPSRSLDGDRDRRMNDRLSRAWGDPRAAAHLDRPVAPRRLARHHRLAVARHRARSSPASRSMPTARSCRGSVGSERAIVNTLVTTMPLLLGGLSVGLGFKAGLFNIGAQGQFLMGALGSVIVGVQLRDSPAVIADPRRAGRRDALRGRRGASSPGFLKAVSGAHEVVTTIMLNFVAIADPGGGGQRAAERRRAPRRRSRLTSATPSLPVILGRNGHHRHHLRAADGACCTASCCSGRPAASRSGSPGASPDAARYAGMSPRGLIIWTMTVSGHARRAWPARPTCWAPPTR